MIHDEGSILQEVLTNGLPCDLKLQSYNEAISLQAKLNRYIKNMQETYAGRADNQWEDLNILLIKPKTLRFERYNKVKLWTVGQSDAPETP